jgi:hypothetical protein
MTATASRPLHRVECACGWIGYRRSPHCRPCPACAADPAKLQAVWLAGCAPHRGRCCYLIEISPAYRHARHYLGKAASSGLLTALWRVNGSEFAELTLVALLRNRGSRPSRRGVCCQLLELVPRVVLPTGALHGDATPGGQPRPRGRQRAGPAWHGRSARQPRANGARNDAQHPQADRQRGPAWSCPLGDTALVPCHGDAHNRPDQRRPRQQPRVGRVEPPPHPHAQRRQRREHQDQPPPPPPPTPRRRRGPRRHRIRVGLACTLSHSTLLVWLVLLPYPGCSAPPTTHARRSTGRQQATGGLA